MRKISSRFTPAYKYGMPTAILLILLQLGRPLGERFDSTTLHSVYVVGFLAALITLAWLYRRWLWTLMDEVEDHERYLEVRFHSVRERIFFGNIREITLRRSNPPIITLHLQDRCLLGKEVSFVPRLQLFTFMEPPELSELRARLRRPVGPRD